MLLSSPKPEKFSANFNNLKILLVFRLKILLFLVISELSLLETTNLPSSHHPDHNIWEITQQFIHTSIFCNRSIHPNHPSPKIITVRIYPPSWLLQIFQQSEHNKSTKSLAKVDNIALVVISNVSFKSLKLHARTPHSLELLSITILTMENFSLL